MSFQKKLFVYLDSWVSKGIINENQKLLIQKDIKSETNSSLFFTIISIIGALFIGGGILLFISANWEDLPKFVKLILILAMPIVSIGGGYYLSYVKKEYKKIGDSFIFLGSLLIGASLALLGQLYNFEGSSTGLLIWWLILSLPLTFILKFKSIATLNIVLFYLIIFFSFKDYYHYNFEENILLTFFIVSILIIISTIFIAKINKQIIKQYLSIINVFKIISIKVLLGTLFIGTLVDFFSVLFGSGEGIIILHNIAFLIVLFLVMWKANRTYNVILRHITFIWLGLFIILKYFTWFGSYMNTGIFFVLFGIFLLGLVYAYIKGIKYLEQIKNKSFEEGKKYNEENSL